MQVVRNNTFAQTFIYKVLLVRRVMKKPDLNGDQVSAGRKKAFHRTLTRISFDMSMFNHPTCNKYNNSN